VRLNSCLAVAIQRAPTATPIQGAKHCRYRGLELRKGDGHRLKKLEAKGAGVRVTKRTFALRLLSQGKGLVDAATSVVLPPRSDSSRTHGVGGGDRCGRAVSRVG
jgi:hypothetical protein